MLCNALRVTRGKHAVELKGIQLEFGTILNSWLGRKQWKAYSFASEIEMDVSQLSKIINGKANLSLSTILRILRGLGLPSLREFYAGKEFSALEHRFKDEFDAIRQLLLDSDEEGLNDLRKALRRIPLEVRERAGPIPIRKAGLSIS